MTLDEWKTLSDDDRAAYMKGVFTARLELAFWVGISINDIEQVFEAREAMESGDTDRAKSAAVKAAEKMMKKGSGVLG